MNKRRVLSPRERIRLYNILRRATPIGWPKKGQRMTWMQQVRAAAIARRAS